MVTRVLPVMYDLGGIDDQLEDFVKARDTIVNPILDRAEAAQEYATDVQNIANDAIQALADAGASTLDETLFEGISDTLFDINSPGIDGLNITEPTPVSLDAVTIAEPTTVIPGLPEMDDSNIDGIIGDVPVFDAIKAAINIPDLPGDEFPIFTAAEPTQTEPNLPSKPEYTLPALPTIEDVSIPSPPEYNIASFEGTMPVDDLTPPATLFHYNEGEYSSDVANKLAEKLLYDLTNGGSGLDTDTEQAIWDRATARQEAERAKTLLAAHEYHSSRGFNLPEGVLAGAVLEEFNNAAQAKDDLNNDLLVQQSNLAQVNTHFIITQAIGMENNLMNNSNQVQNRAFETAKAVVTMANEIYRIKVEAFIARLEGYKVQASVFEIKIRAEIAKAEFYKAQIEGIKAGVEAKGLLISAYNSQIEGIKSLIQMYATEMEAAKIGADIDRLKIEAYKTKAEVFGIQTNAITSKYNAYQMQIAGETEKVKMYLADTQAYTSKVEGFKAGAGVEQMKAEVKLAKHKGDIEAFVAAIEYSKIESDMLIARAEISIKADGLEIEKYKADTSKYETSINALIQDYLGKVQKATDESNVLIKEREVAITKLLGEKGITTDMIIAQSKIAGQLTAASLTAVSSSTSLGLDQSHRISTSVTKGKSMRQSVSEAFNHQVEDSSVGLV